MAGWSAQMIRKPPSAAITPRKFGTSRVKLTHGGEASATAQIVSMKKKGNIK